MSKRTRPLSIESWAPPGLISHPPPLNSVVETARRVISSIPRTPDGRPFRERVRHAIHPEQLSSDLKRQAADLMAQRAAYWARAQDADSHIHDAAVEREALGRHAPAIVEFSCGIGKDIEAIRDIGSRGGSPRSAARLKALRTHLMDRDGRLLKAMEAAYQSIDAVGSALIALAADPQRGIPGLLQESQVGHFQRSRLFKLLEMMLGLRENCRVLEETSPVYREIEGLSIDDLHRYFQAVAQEVGDRSETTEALARSMHLFNSLEAFFKALKDPLVPIEALARQFTALFKNHLNLLFNAIAGQTLSYLPVMDGEPAAAGPEAEYMLIRLRIINECLMGLYFSRKQARLLRAAT